MYTKVVTVKAYNNVNQSNQKLTLSQMNLYEWYKKRRIFFLTSEADWGNNTLHWYEHYWTNTYSIKEISYKIE